jgi:glycosyltransferase involved in cell wall biosynthesis
VTIESVLFFGTIKEDAPPNIVKYRGLHELGVETQTVNTPKILTEGGEAIKEQHMLKFLLLLILQNSLSFFVAIKNVRFFLECDVVFLPWASNYSCFSVYPVAKIARKPVILDGHTSVYLAQVHGREYVSSDSLRGRLYRRLDAASITLFDSYLVFTAAAKDLFSELYDVNQDRLDVLYTGGIRPPSVSTSDRDDEIDVLYWGNFLPTHGVEHAVEGLAEYERNYEENLNIMFVGSGEKRTHCQRLAEECEIDVDFPGYIPRDELERYIESADIVLGVFGKNSHTDTHIFNKVVEAAAREKAILTSRSTAITELFSHKESIYLTDPCDPAEFSANLDELLTTDNLRESIATNAKRTYQDSLTPVATATRFLKIAESIH